MTDYTSPTGSGGMMLIRDLGNEVQFHIIAGSSQTFVGSLNWSWNSSTGAGGSASVTYPSGGQWLYLGSIYVDATQDIRFAIGATGTSGLGGPSEFTVNISRAPTATVPGAPTPVYLNNIGHTTMQYGFQGTTDGGSPIREWQIGYGTDPNNPQATIASNGQSTISGLNLATRYYVWSRGRNDIGWGPWSARWDARTLAGARVRVAGVWREAVAFVKVGGSWKQAIPFIKQNNVWKDGK